MAKQQNKAGVANDKKVKKKGKGCGCFLASFAIFVVIVVAGVGVGAYFADGYLQSTFGIGITDAFVMVGDLAVPSRNKVVTNETKQDDKDTLYQSVDEKLMLKTGTLTEEAMDDILNELFGLDTGVSDPLTGTGGSGLSPTIEGLIKKENIDYDRVRATFTDSYNFDENYERDFVVTLSDRQLKIFAERLLMSNMEKMGDEVADLLDKITFEQLKMTRVDDTPTMAITVRLSVDDFVNAYMPEGMEFFSTVALAVLPDELYITLNVKLDDVKNEYSFSFNAMSEDTQNKMYKLISGILKLTGQSETDPNQYVYDLIDSSVVDFIDSASKWINIDQVTIDGYVTLDLYEIVAESIGSDLTAREFAQLYTSVLCGDAERMIEQNQDKLFKEMSTGDTPVYTSEKVQAQFLDEFHGKYLMREDFYLDKDAGENAQRVFFNPTDEQITSLDLTHYTLSFADVSALFGVGTSTVITELEGYGVNLESLLDASGLMKKLYGEQTDDRAEWFVNEDKSGLTFNFTDKMLAALIDSQLDSVLSGMSGSLDGFELEFLSIEKGETEQVSNGLLVDNVDFDNYQVDINRVYVTLGFIVDTAEFIDSAHDLVAEILPEKVGFIVKLDITPTLISSALNSHEMKYCDLSSARTNDLIGALNKLGITLLTDDQISDNLVKPIRDMFNDMSELMGEVVVEDGKIILSDIFQIIATHGFVATDEVKGIYGVNASVSADEVQSVLKGLVDIPSIATDNGRLYLSNAPTAEESENSILGCANLYYNGKDNDRVTTDKFNDNFLEPAKSMSGVSLDKAGDAVGYYNVDGERYMYITVSYDLSAYLYEHAMCLLPVKTVYATFVIDKDQIITVAGTEAYATEVYVNGMNETQMNALEKILVFGNTSNAGKFTKLAGEMGVLARIVDLSPGLLEPSV
ncbi:MAG: hypothetical protein IKC64_04390 [Clostridia bacterium]|nr:hypothetical protein [Clostridia bacterium]